ncbi:unnamed protein product [Arctia plantaginis]|uniref:DH domain-containing protein n=1 Tax=Arctia plantaginis TaxID=874455 RepID=A0A8S0Z0L2_ARCPL|nr:unnamed protein product [Arctia plantaginis]
MATAHALQDMGMMLDIETSRLFTNTPDILNASLYFWEASLYPMLQDAASNGVPFNTELMAPGFCRFNDLFFPYEKYMLEQTKALDYLRSLNNNTEFMTYLTWCHSQKACNRLQLSDIMVKPMQRLTKYSLILRRIIAHTETEPERTNLRAMETFTKNFVVDLNRSIRQREELEKIDQLLATIEPYEIEFKDDDMEKYFRVYSGLNLKAPMVGCGPNHSRTLIHQGDLRFKDNAKEIEARVFLLTDMILICKKVSSKGGSPQYKLIRPKFFIDHVISFPRFARNAKDPTALIFVVVDEVGSSHFTFALSDINKDHNTLKIWEQKLREAKLTYELAVWLAKNPSRDISEIDMDSSSDYAASVPTASKQGQKQTSEDLNIERIARERVAVMLHRSMGASTEHDFSQATMATDSFDGEPQSFATSGGRGYHGLRHPMNRNSTGGSSRNSRLSSFQQSTSAASHDEPQFGQGRYQYRAGSSVEHVIPPLHPDEGVTSITVNVVSESDSETMVQKQSPQTPMLVFQQPSPHKTPVPSRSPSGSRNTLRVQPQNVVMALVHSLPDLSFEPSSQPPRPQQSPSPQSASEKLYQSHQELLHRNRLSAQQHQHYLTPDHRGTSYPPPSPTSRASLKRGLAFSYSFKNPPLLKMGHVNSQSQLHPEAGPSTSGGSKAEKGGSPVPGPSTSSDIKPDKKSKHFSSRSKSGGSVSPGGSRKGDKKD